MEAQTITFDAMPQAVGTLLENQRTMQERIETMHRTVENLVERLGNVGNDDASEWFTPQQLSEYLPDHPTIPTIYGWTHFRKVPYCKRGKMLMFKKSDIDKWLQSGRRKTQAEIQEEVMLNLKTPKRCATI